MTIRLGNKIISGGGSSGVPGWTGTLAEYNALTEIDDEMLYYITDDCLDSNSNNLGGLDIGDVGFTALGVNEELNCRRYLNGQVLAMDEFPEFTSKLKHAASLNSSIAVDEDVWQTELAMSANGICYKFVIDDKNMTIRLPKYPEYFIAGLSDSTGVAGNGIGLGLTDGTNNLGIKRSSQLELATYPETYGTPVGQRQDITVGGTVALTLGVTPDPTKSGIEALVDSASEKVYGFYFIQVANGLEQTVDITREITLNNPFFLGMYQYFEVEPNNISWLKSEGQWNSAEVYPGMWKWLHLPSDLFVLGGATQEGSILSGFNPEHPTYINDSSDNAEFYFTVPENPNTLETLLSVSDGLHVQIAGGNYLYISNLQRDENGNIIGGGNPLTEVYTQLTPGNSYIIKMNSGTLTLLTSNGETLGSGAYATGDKIYLGSDSGATGNNYGYFTGTIDLSKSRTTSGDIIVNKGTYKTTSQEYTDYDWVIDRGTNTFRLPIKVKGAAGKAVAGNGMTLGITDGVNEFGLQLSTNSTCLAIEDDMYGTTVGTDAGARNGKVGITYGITTDPTKSGIETSTEGLHLYFYVGETVQDPTLINVGRLTHAVSLKTDKEQAAHAGMPSDEFIHLTLGASGSTYIAPADGYFTFQGLSTAAKQYVRLETRTEDGRTKTKFQHHAYTSGVYITLPLSVPKGGKVYIEYTLAKECILWFNYANGSQPTN